MRVYNVNAREQFKYARNDYKKSERWKEKASTRKLIYTIGMGIGGIVVIVGMLLEQKLEQIPFPPLPIFLLAVLSGCFFGWIPGISYSKLSGAKCLAISTIEKRRDDVLLIDENILRYLYIEVACARGRKEGYKMLLEDVESITYNKERQLLTVFGKGSWGTYDFIEEKDWSEYENENGKIEIPMYFEDNEAILKDLKEILEKRQKKIEFVYI